MLVYWLWTGRKVSSHFANSEQLRNLAVILLALKKSKNLVVILLLIVGHGCFLDMGWQFWNAFLEGAILKCTHILYCFLSFYSYPMVALLFLKSFQLELGKTKIHREFLISLILCLHCWYNKKLKTKHYNNAYKND